MSNKPLKDRMGHEIKLGNKVAPGQAAYWVAETVEALGDGIVYTTDGNRYEVKDILAVQEDSPKKWTADCADEPQVYFTLCGQKMACESAAEKAEDLLLRAFIMAKTGRLDEYMKETYSVEFPEVGPPGKESRAPHSPENEGRHFVVDNGMVLL